MSNPDREFAPAKINLFLHITGKREDGYHNLQSLIFFADIGDEISLQPSAALHDRLTLSGPFAAELSAQDNLILKAVNGLRQHHPDIPPLDIHLTKNLPIASGIGGGTADAAAVLRLIEKKGYLHSAQGAARPVSSKRSEDGSERVSASEGGSIPLSLLKPLGAEFPVCYASKPALVEGIGEILTPMPALPDWGILLVNPLKPLPTPAAFKVLQPADFLPPASFIAPQSGAEWLSLFQNTQNTMTRAATTLLPEIPAMLSLLEDTPHCLGARMSGSGATCFGLYPTRESALQALNLIVKSHPGWWFAAGSVLSPNI